jgi:exopolysaccharide biosynthesis polyprenyl glycosylphosphotransferase
MFPRHSLAVRLSLLLGDLLLTLGALLLANFIRYRVPLGLEPDLVYVTPGISALVLAIWSVVFSLWGAYDEHNLHERSVEIRTVLFAATFSLFTLAAFFYFLKIKDFSRLLFLYFYLLDVAELVTFRLAMWRLFTHLRLPGYGRRRVLIVGTGSGGLQLACQLQSWPDYEVLGFVDDESQSTATPSFSLLGTLAECPDVVSRHNVDEVFIALPPGRPPSPPTLGGTGGGHRASLSNLILALQQRGVRIRFVPDLLDILTVHTAIENLRGVPFVTVREPPISGLNAIIKRTSDLCGALIGLVLCAPLMGIIALLIKLDSSGPISFRQERAGRYGRPFWMWKFRTMVADAEQQLPQFVDVEKLEQPVFKLQNDPRVTRMGHWLRRTSLDELPQFMNVLRGEMSLVGPRPEQVDLVERYNAWQAQRLLVKPGMTGSMQVSGRGDLPFEERLKLELAYIENYTLWEDIKILLKTIPAVLSSRGAY